jgi:formamidopyrimidine-DNA glycosylase
MPELPEVEIMRRYFEEVALHKKITQLEFHDQLDKVYKSSRKTLKEKLVGSKFEETKRIGKYFFARLSTQGWLHLHFGMTGNLELFRTEDLPKYTRLVFNFEDGDKLAFRDLRKFGVVQWIPSVEDFVDAQNLGRDLLQIDTENFVKGLEGRKVAIKTALLDQKHFAGIGNWIADEMLFNCGIHPQERCHQLKVKQLKALLQSGVEIVKEAIKADTHYGDFPQHFFVNYRKEKAIHPKHPQSPVERLVVGGRGTFIVPEKQILKKSF